MNKRFDIFMKAVEDDLLEEAQLSFPRRHSLSKMLALAACLCIVTGVYFVGAHGFGAKSEESAAPDVHYSTTAAAAQGVPESAPSTTSDEISTEATVGILPMPTEAGTARALLPKNAVVCSYSVTGDVKSVDFSIGDMEFTLYSKDTSDESADSKRMNTLISDKENESISWYSDDGDTGYTLELNDGDFELLYDTAEEIAENLGLDISD